MSALHSASRTYPNNIGNHTDDNDNILDVWKNYLRSWTKASNSGNEIEICKSAQLLAASYSVPNELRSEIWFIISGAKQLMNRYSNTKETTYQYLSNKHDTIYLDQINKDYERTFVTKNLTPITTQKIQHQLRRMLIAYANYNPDIGYAQGMNMVAAFILRQFLQHNEFFNTQYNIMNIFNDDDDDNDSFTVNSSLSSLIVECDHNEDIIEEHAFWCFVCIMTNITTLFERKLAGYHEAVKCLVNVLKRNDYMLWKHFDTMGIDTLFTGVFIKWFTSLFAYPSFNLNITQKLWDMWLLQRFDYGVFIKFAYCLMESHRTELLTMNDIEIPVFCISSSCIVTDKHWMLTLLKLKMVPLILGHKVEDEKNNEEMELVGIDSLIISDIRCERSYGEYQLDIKCDGFCWSVWKRYSEFERLCHGLKVLGIESDHECVFPAKSWLFASNNASLMRTRKIGLNEYLKSVLMKYNHINNTTNHKRDGSLLILHRFVNYFSFYRR